MENNTAQLEARVQKLESLIQRHGTGGGGFPFAGPVVANEAAAAAFSLSDTPGSTVEIFVLSHRSIWTKRNGVAGVQGVPPLSPHEVIAATAGPAGVLCRTMYSDPALRIGINDIFIDPALGAANDENDGLTAGTPLKTGQELFRRWGWGAPVLVGPNLVTSPDGFTNVNIQSDLVSPDQLDLNIIMTSNGSMRFRGAILPANVIRTSTLTGASTAMNPGAPLGGTRLRLVDAATATWVPDMAANRRGRITTGAQAGATFQPQTNIGAGGAVDCSAAQTTNEPAFSTTPTTVTPANGSTYVIEKLVQCNFGSVTIAQQQNPAFGGFNTFINFIDLNFPAIGTNGVLWAPVTPPGTFSTPFLNFYQCTFDRLVDLTATPGAQMVACYWFNSSIFNFCAGGIAGVLGGGMNSIGPGVSEIIWATSSNQSSVDFNFVANRSLILFGGTSAARIFASWNALALAGINSAGHGIVVAINGTGGVRANVTFSSTVWGNGNGGAGILVGAGCKGVGGAQNITGTQGDLKLALSLVGWWWNAATALYNPVGAGITLTWAHVAAAKGAAGFGGSAHEPDQDAHWNLTETTA